MVRVEIDMTRPRRKNKPLGDSSQPPQTPSDEVIALMEPPFPVSTKVELLEESTSSTLPEESPLSPVPSPDLPSGPPALPGF